MVVSLNYCSQNGGNLYRAPYYNGSPNIGPRIIGNLDQFLDASKLVHIRSPHLVMTGMYSHTRPGAPFSSD